MARSLVLACLALIREVCPTFGEDLAHGSGSWPTFLLPGAHSSGLENISISGAVLEGTQRTSLIPMHRTDQLERTNYGLAFGFGSGAGFGFLSLLLLLLLWLWLRHGCGFDWILHFSLISFCFWDARSHQ